MMITLEEILDEEERKIAERRTEERIARGEIPDPFADIKARIRACFAGPKIKARELGLR